jgi:hypothetical protein
MALLEVVLSLSLVGFAVVGFVVWDTIDTKRVFTTIISPPQGLDKDRDIYLTQEAYNRYEEQNYESDNR